MSDVPLFEGYDPPERPEGRDLDGLSPGQRLTRRQRADVAAGRHPLTGGPLHPQASRALDGPRRHEAPFTCGGCKFLMGSGYLKCWLPGPTGKPIPARMTHGPASDVRRWWPACPDYVARS